MNVSYNFLEVPKLDFGICGFLGSSGVARLVSMVICCLINYYRGCGRLIYDNIEALQSGTYHVI